MLTPSADILPGLSVFAPAMTAPTYQNALTLLCGTLLASGPRTVTAALRALGLTDANFSRYHRFFTRARWSPMLLSRLLLGLLVRTFVPPGEVLRLLVDETLERRKSRQLAYRGLFRDPVRSTAEGVQFAWGIRWLCFCLLVPVPWSRRPWALPFLLLPLLSEQACRRLRRPHRTVVEQTAHVLGHLRHWVPERPLVLVGDNAYAAVPLADCCRHLRPAVTLVSRLRLDAVLHAFPTPPPPGKRGPKPKKGPRLPKLAAQLHDPATRWQALLLDWYGEPRVVEVATGVALWYRSRYAPVPVRWVLVRPRPSDPAPFEPGACFATDPEATVAQIVAWFLGRWNIEVTFAELRAHLGFETQRYWSRAAAGRVTPCLCGLFSLVVVLAKALHPRQLPVPQSGWYAKEEASFADALAAVRRHLWRALWPAPSVATNYVGVPQHGDHYLIPSALWQRIEQVACYAT
jgi:hypothetical protein